MSLGRLDHYWLTSTGEPEVCGDLITWAMWFKTADRVVAQTAIDERVRVSTVFLGVDHNFGPHGPPVLWETMTFGGARDGDTQQYTSRAEAERGHARAVRRAVRATA